MSIGAAGRGQYDTVLVALAIPYDGNRSIRHSPYNGGQYGAILVGVSSAVAAVVAY